MEVTVSIYMLNPKLFLDSPHHNRRQTQDFRVWNGQQSFSQASSFLPLLFLLTKARCILNLLTPLVRDNTKKPCNSKEHEFLCPAASFSGLADSLANIPRFTYCTTSSLTARLQPQSQKMTPINTNLGVCEEHCPLSQQVSASLLILWRMTLWIAVRKRVVCLCLAYWAMLLVPCVLLCQTLCHTRDTALM